MPMVNILIVIEAVSHFLQPPIINRVNGDVMMLLTIQRIRSSSFL